MILTNNHNLPAGIYNAILRDIYKPVPEVMRVTELINPPRIKNLQMKHWDKLTLDASEYLWSILGTAVHYILKDDEAITELHYEIVFEGQLISGHIDRVENDVIEDYKTTSVWSFLDGVKPEWAKQLNIYRWLYNGYEITKIKKLRINAILRDWSTMKASIDHNYPQIPFQQLDVPIDDDIEEKIRTRLSDHKKNPFRMCSFFEKWQRPDKYAIMKKGRKSAVRVLDQFEQCEQYIL